MNENRKPHAIVLRAAAVLLILVLFTTSIVSGRYARYTSSATGHDSARVAKFRVTEEGIDGQMSKVSIAPGQTAKHEIIVHNDSEVAIAYSVIADNKHQNLPLTISVSDGKTTGSSVTLDPGVTKTVNLQIYWDETKNEDKYIGMVDTIHLVLTAAQID